MPATELELMLGAAAWRLQAGAEDPALTSDALREMARDSAMLLQQLRPELAAMRLALARAQAGERQALQRAERDSLTTLPNRDGFDSRLHSELGAREPAPRMLAVLFLDLDRFKQVNDRHGHAVGDALLRGVARRLRSAVRASIGIAMCPTDGDNAAALLQRADAAMFRAKRQQCGLAFFDAGTDPLGRLPAEAMAHTSGGRLGGR
jgi:diguanylate cyclase